MIRRIAAAVGCLLIAATALGERRAQHVIIVSLDGGKPAVIKLSKMPTLMRLAKEGAVTWEAHTTLPSITLTSHTSMLTGVDPATHKVLWNEWKPDKGLVPGPTVFSVAKKAKLKTAIFAAKEKFISFALPASLNALSIQGGDARIIAESAAVYLKREKPDLMFVHFADPDSAGHKFGWGSPEQIKAFETADKGIAILIKAVRKAELADNTVLIITADHGGHAKTHGLNIPDDVNIPWVAWGKPVNPHFVITAPITTYDTAATALWLLDLEIPTTWVGKPVTTAFAEPEIAK